MYLYREINRQSKDSFATESLHKGILLSGKWWTFKDWQQHEKVLGTRRVIKSREDLINKGKYKCTDIHVRSLLACHRMNIHQSISNLDMARERLAQTEKRPLKRSEKKNAYINTVCNIWKKDKESFLEDGIKDSLLLHNFIFFWMDKETTKNA